MVLEQLEDGAHEVGRMGRKDLEGFEGWERI